MMFEFPTPMGMSNDDCRMTNHWNFEYTECRIEESYQFYVIYIILSNSHSHHKQINEYWIFKLIQYLVNKNCYILFLDNIIVIIQL